MWMFCRDGFFSVVQNQYCKPDELVVRARNLDDISRFCLATGTDKSDILVTTHADYRYRVHVPKKTWAQYAMQAAEGIDYTNFKSATCRSDADRASAYHACWHALVEWQETSRR